MISRTDILTVVKGSKKAQTSFSKAQPVTLSAAYIIVPQRYTLKIKSSPCFHVGKFWHKSRKRTRWSLQGWMWHTSAGATLPGGGNQGKAKPGKILKRYLQNKTRQLPVQDTFTPWKRGFDFWLQLFFKWLWISLGICIIIYDWKQTGPQTQYDSGVKEE